jgi:hypothetical protein
LAEWIEDEGRRWQEFLEKDGKPTNARQVYDNQAYFVRKLVSQLDDAIIVKPYTYEMQNGAVKYVYVRDASASATTWEEAVQRLQEFYEEEAMRAEATGYMRGGMTQGKGE